jgi:hypothetical protein
MASGVRSASAGCPTPPVGMQIVEEGLSLAGLAVAYSKGWRRASDASGHRRPLYVDATRMKLQVGPARPCQLFQAPAARHRTRPVPSQCWGLGCARSIRDERIRWRGRPMLGLSSPGKPRGICGNCPRLARLALACGGTPAAVLYNRLRNRGGDSGGALF